LSQDVRVVFGETENDVARFAQPASKDIPSVAVIEMDDSRSSADLAKFWAGATSCGGEYGLPVGVVLSLRSEATPPLHRQDSFSVFSAIAQSVQTFSLTGRWVSAPLALLRRQLFAILRSPFSNLRPVALSHYWVFAPLTLLRGCARPIFGRGSVCASFLGSTVCHARSSITGSWLGADAAVPTPCPSCNLTVSAR